MKRWKLGRVGIFLMVISLCFNGIYIPASAAETRTEYRYHHYSDDKGNVSICAYYGNWKYNTSSMKKVYTDWLTEPLAVDNGQYSYYTHVYQGRSCDKAGCTDSSVDTNRYVDANGTYWFYQETRVVEVKPTVTVQPTVTPASKPTVTSAPPSTVTPTTKPIVTPTPKPATPAPQPATPTPVPVVVIPQITVTPTVTPKPENDVQIIFQDIPKNETDIWDEIGAELLQYAIDILDCIIDALSPEDELKVTKALLSTKDLLNNKELIKNLIKVDLLGKIENKDIMNQLLEIVENTADMEGVPDEVLGETANLLYKVVLEQPELQKHIIYTLIKYSPRLVLKVVTGNCGDKIPILKLLIGIFETSAERFWNLGEALSKYVDAVDAVEDSLVERYNNLVLHNYKFYSKVTEHALEDKEQGTSNYLNEIEYCENTMDGIRDEIVTSIDEKLSFWFKLLHPERAEHLKEVRDELCKLEFDYMDCYLEIVNN